MYQSNSPLESLAAFFIVLVVGIISTLGFSAYIKKVRRNAAKATV